MDRIPILQMGRVLLITIQVDLHDRLAMSLEEDLTVKISTTRAKGVLIDISESSYASGLEKIGAATASHVDLLTQFDLGRGTALVAGSLRAQVDHASVQASFDALSGRASIDARDAGGAGSVIDLEACRAD